MSAHPGIFLDRVEGYLARTALLSPPPHPVLERMRILGTERHFPIVGPEVGRVFLQLAALRAPRRLLELGSGFGYSALWWAFGAPAAEIHLTDHKQSNLDEARAFAAEAGVAGRMHFHRGDALKIAASLAGPWDILFCDIDKEQYPAAIDLALGTLAPGGLLVFDNMLWHGHVALPAGDHDRTTEAIIETTCRLYRDPRWSCSLLPVRDGVLVALRNPG